MSRKNDLGLDHLECRGWHALQHHTMLVRIAMVFLQYLRIGGKRKGRSRVGPPPSPSLPQI
jgi:SRSO17 transposase